MIRSAFSYARSFAACLTHGERRALLRAHRGQVPTTAVDHQHALREAVGWLMHAQDRCGGHGIGSFHLVSGWGAPYPETTGYLIPTLLDAARRLAWDAPAERAVRAAEWLLTIQRPDGGWQGGRVGEARPSIVFNTAQVVRGMLAAHAHTRRDEFLIAARRAADWMVEVQETDGSWRTHNFLGAARAYDTYVDAPLLALFTIGGEERYRQAAMRNLTWVLAQQRTNGWFANADNTIAHNDRPITHTIAYTIDGLLECGGILGDRAITTAGLKAARPLLDAFLRHGALRGRYDAQWHGSEHAITTGCAQLAICWTRACRLTSASEYREGAERMVQWLIGVQQLSHRGPQEVHGAMPGSFPLWGRYEKFAFPNWATKYFADALLCVEDLQGKA